MAAFNPENFISDETLHKLNGEHNIGWNPETKKEVYHNCLTPEARQQILLEYFIKELDRIADKIIEAINK